MDELIKIKDIGYSDEPESGVNNNDSDEYVFSSEDTEEYTFNSSMTISLGQIILFQCVICVLIVVAIIILNYAKPDMTKDFLHNCHIQIDSDFNYKHELTDIVSKLTKIINAKI